MRPAHRWACVLAVAAAAVCWAGVARLSPVLDRRSRDRGGAVAALAQARAVRASTALELVPGLAPDYHSDEEDSEDEAYFAYDSDPALGSGGRHSLALHMLPNDLYPDAVCNDGTAAGFYYRKGGSDDSGFLIEDPRWLVFLQGGGWCWDEESCEQRKGIYPNLMSSKTWTKNKALSGIFSHDALSSPLATASKVFVPYCSSGVRACTRCVAQGVRCDTHEEFQL